MVPAARAVYLPPLNQCLSGEEPLISWSDVRSALCDRDANQGHASLETFLQDETTRDVLVQSVAAHVSINAQTEADFESLIAAVNASTSQTGRYDIECLKSDSLKLSREAKIDQVSALRIVVLEWQQRPSRALISTWSTDEVASLQRNTSGVNAAAMSTLPTTSPMAHGSARSDVDADGPRHARQMDLLIRENAECLSVLETLAASPIPSGRSWLHAVAGNIRQRLDDLSGPTSKKPLSTLAPYCEAIKSRLDAMADTSQWPHIIAEDANLTRTKAVKTVEELVTLVRLTLSAVLKLPSVAAEEDIMAWFQLMDETNFLSDLPILDPAQEQPLYTAQALASVVSVALLTVSESLGYLQSRFGAENREPHIDTPQNPYLDSEPSIALLTNTLLGAASLNLRHAAPVVLAWSIITQTLRDLASAADMDSRRLSIDSSDPEGSLSRRSSLRGSVSRTSRPGALLAHVLDAAPGEDAIALMGNASVIRMAAFDTLTAITGILTRFSGTPSDSHVPVLCREVFMALLREVLPLVSYGPDIIEALLAVLSYDSLGIGSTLSKCQWPAGPAQSLLDDAEVMGPKLIDQILKRYPFELGPFMSCLTALSKSRASIEQGESRTMLLLEDLSTFTMAMPHDFNSYELSQEDEVANVVRLTRDVPIFISRHKSPDSSSHSATGALSLPAGTFGTILNDSKPFVICWQYNHSAFEYLGRLLSTRLGNAPVMSASTGQPVDLETATDIILLFTSVVESLAASGNCDTAKQLLGRMSNGLSRNDDIIRVVFEIFDSEVQLHHQQDSQLSLAFLEASVRFITSLVKLFPERVWSFLARSKLLAAQGDTNTLAAIVNTSEATLNSYPFLRSCVLLFEALIGSATVQSPTHASAKALTRFEAAAPTPVSLSDKTMSTVLLAFQRVLTDFLQGMAGWRFTDIEEQIELQVTITRTLSAVLDCALGVENASRNNHGLAAVFRPAADSTLAAFLNKDKLAFQTFLDTFIQALLADEDVTLQEREARRALTCEAVALCTTLLNAARTLQMNVSAMVDHLLESMPLLVRLYALHSSYRERLTDLITSLVGALKETRDIPPSLLVHVSPEATKLFITVLSRVKRPLTPLETEVRTWNMLSAIVSSKQQLLAIYLLTGGSPRDRLGQEKSADKTEKDNGGTRLLVTALDQLANLDSIAPRCAKTMLDFVANCQNHWPWATGIIKMHATFITSITNWLGDLKSHSRPVDPEVATRLAHENQMAGSIADILATYLHSVTRSEAEKLIAEITPKLQHLVDHAADVSSYNRSLHSNLTKNFLQNFPNCDLHDLRRSTLHPTDYGRTFYYDLDRAERMLGTHSAWDRRNGQSFVDEVARASVNFALVDSEIVLLKQWKSLTIEIGARAGGRPEVQRLLAKVVERCLRANLEPSLPEGLCDDLSEHRADLAFTLLQRLVSAKAAEPAAAALIRPAWDAVRTRGQDFDVISEPKDATSYRLLLRILFLALQLQPPADKKVEARSRDRKRASLIDGKQGSSGETTTLGATMLEIVQKVVAVNFRALCSSVHDRADQVDPSDFVLLTAILQSVLGAKDAQSLQQQIATIISESSLIRYATSLYSWSHSLSATSDATDDPLYGLLSILFLLSLSNITLCAEEMAVSCVMTHLSTAATSARYFRNPRGGSGPFDQPQRAHEIWARGILPLCLNLLEAVGPAIAGEVSAFLNSFPNQLARLECDLAPPHIGGYQKGQNHQGTGGRLTLNLASEAHSVCLLGLILDKLRLAGASVETSGVRSDEIEVLKCDRGVIKEYIDGLLGPRREDGSVAHMPLQSCVERIVPVGIREQQWSRKPARAHDSGSGGQTGPSVLEKRVMAELIGAADCLVSL